MFNATEDIEMTDLGPLSYQQIGPKEKNDASGTGSSNAKDSKVSIHYKIAEEFLKICGHECLIKRIENKENPLPVSILMKFIDISVELSQYIRSYESKKSELQEFPEAVLKVLEEYVNSDMIIQSIKEFKFEYFSSIQAAIVKFKLGKDFDERKVFLSLEIAQKCLNSGYLSIRVQGCKEIENKCSSAMRSNALPFKGEVLAKWVSENEVISSIFGANHHSELIGRSEYIIKLLSSKIGLKEEEVKLIWNLTNRDKQTKKEIYTILQKVGDILDKESTDYVLGRAREFELLTNDDLSFIYSYKRQTDFQVETTWKIVNQSGDYPQEVVQSAFDKLVDMIKYSNLETKLDNLKKSHEKLLAHDSSLIFLKILKATLKNVNLATARVQNLGEEFIKAKDDLIVSFYIVSRVSLIF